MVGLCEAWGLQVAAGQVTVLMVQKSGMAGSRLRQGAKKIKLRAGVTSLFAELYKHYILWEQG